MESLLYIAAFIGNVFSAEPKTVVALLTGLSKLNARLVSLAPGGIVRPVSSFSRKEAVLYAEALALVAYFQEVTDINIELEYSEHPPLATSASRLRLEFPGTRHGASAPLLVESTEEALKAAEEENWELVRDMFGHRVGLNILAEHTAAFDTLSESNVEHIEGKIQDGYIEGEFFESLSVDEADLRGYWKILS
ncbi:hypothetical protein P5X00_36875 [Paraburkholderia sp. A2RO-4L]|uniref:hypothetical protein n=1 Tax=Paraburkholderia sp. A2RO-4L TaxID=3028374 RepID=UPI003DA89945